jgi:hypothetical protein
VKPGAGMPQYKGAAIKFTGNGSPFALYRGNNPTHDCAMLGTSTPKTTGIVKKTTVDANRGFVFCGPPETVLQLACIAKAGAPSTATGLTFTTCEAAKFTTM